MPETQKTINECPFSVSIWIQKVTKITLHLYYNYITITLKLKLTFFV